MKNRHIIFLIATVVATGGLLFGFDTGGNFRSDSISSVRLGNR